MKNLASLLLCALLSACGGGGGGSSPEPAPSQPVAVALPLIMVYGDSVSRGDGVVNTASVAQKLVTGLAELRQEGVPGSYAQQLVDGQDGMHGPWGATLKDSQARVVSFNYGINDPYPLEDYRSYLTRLVQGAQAAGKVTILQTPNAITAQAQGGDMAERARIGREVAQATGAVLCDQYSNGLARSMRDQTLDGIHPNPMQYAVMGELFATCVRQALAAIGG